MRSTYGFFENSPTLLQTDEPKKTMLMEATNVDFQSKTFDCSNGRNIERSGCKGTLLIKLIETENVYKELLVSTETSIVIYAIAE